MTSVNFHENLSSAETIELGSNRKFGWLVGGIFALLGAWLFHGGHAFSGLALLALGACLMLGAWLFSDRLTFLHRLWMKFGLLLHHIVNPLVMLLLFCSTIIPVGILMRLCAHDPLRRRFDRNAKTYWIERAAPLQSMKRQF